MAVSVRDDYTVACCIVRELPTHAYINDSVHTHKSTEWAMCLLLVIRVTGLIC